MDRLIIHLLVQLLALHVSLELEGGSLSALLGAIVESMLVDGVGAMDVAGTAGLIVAWVGVLEKLNGTFWCQLKVHSRFYVAKILHLHFPGEIMMVSISFVKQAIVSLTFLTDLMKQP